MTPRVGAAAEFRRRIAERRTGAAFGPAVLRAARRTIDEVREGGDRAVLGHVRRFDRPAARRADLVADRRAIARAARRCPRELREAIDLAHRRIAAFHRAQRPRAIQHRLGGFELSLLPSPLRRVGGCVPRGSSSYPSTALMIGVPASLAGVEELVLCSPMGREGSLDPALAYAASLVGARAVYRAGGASAVAALAYGTEMVERVDKIVGPGNEHTTAAKWLVSAHVGIDGLQGPSELVVVASGDADPRRIALDLLAQSEHGGRPLAALLSDDATLLRAVAAFLAEGPASGIGLYRTASLDSAIALAAEAAPEHLSLAGRRAERLRSRARNAGAVFTGGSTAPAFGDYVAGSNHVLPTGGSARWASPLRVDDFVRWTTHVSARDHAGEALHAATALASYEGMTFHAASVEARR